MKRVAIIGAGMAGWGAAHRLHSRRLESTTYDKNHYPGGHGASHLFRGENGTAWRFDEGPHVSFTKDERIRTMLAAGVKGRFHTLNARVINYWRGHWIKHPAQCNLHGLPANLVTRIIKDFVESQQGTPASIRHYGDWLLAAYGRTFAETFPMVYTRKYHTTPAETMTTDWLGPRLYRPTLEEVLRGALAPAAPDVHYVDEIRYPHEGGFAAYFSPLTGQTDLRLGTRVVRIEPTARRLQLSDGRAAEYDAVISSIPLPELLPLIDGAPREALDAAARLACTTCVLVNLGVDRHDLIDAHWAYFYDSDIFFTRLSTPHLLSPANVPSGCGSLQAECYFSGKYRPLDRRPEDCIDPVIDGLRRCGILRETDRILCRGAMVIPYANIIFDLDRSSALAVVHAYLRDIGIHPCGRYGEWGYQWTDEAFRSGEDAAQRVIESM